MRGKKLTNTRDVQTAIWEAISSQNACWTDAENINTFEDSRNALLELFMLLRADPSEDMAHACAQAVYGWMPTMLKKFDREAAWNLVDDPESGLVTPFVNNSWVGTSKFLHFFDEERYFIWDSRVKRALPGFDVKNAEGYLTYCRAINAASKDERLVAKLKDKMSVCTKNMPSGGRLVEVALYVVGRPKKSKS